MRRNTLGSAISALFSAVTHLATITEETVETAGKVVRIMDNIAETGVKKSDNFRKSSALADDAQYLLDIVALIQSNPEVGEMYLNDPDLLPEGVELATVEDMLKSSNSSLPVKREKRTRSTRSRDTSTQNEEY